MRIILFLFPLLIACQGTSQTEHSSGKKTEKYDGNYGAKKMTPKWLINRDYLQLNIRVQPEETILLGTQKITYEELSRALVDSWEKIKEDDYKGVLSISLGNERETDYAFYQKVHQLIKDSFHAQRVEWAMAKFGMEPIALYKEQEQQLNRQIPILINEKEPEGF